MYNRYAHLTLETMKNIADLQKRQMMITHSSHNGNISLPYFIFTLSSITHFRHKIAGESKVNAYSVSNNNHCIKIYLMIQN